MRNKKISLKYLLFIVFFLLVISIASSQSEDRNDYINSPSNEWNRDTLNFENQAFQNRLNSDENARNWYIREYLGCQQCTFDTGGQTIRYSQEGLVHQKSGLFKNAQALPPGTKLKATSEHIVVVPPDYMKDKSIVGLDITMFGSAKFDLSSTEIYHKIEDGREIPIKGHITVRDGQLYVSNGGDALVDGMHVTAKSNDVRLLFDGNACQGSCISIGKDTLFAKGDGFRFKPIGFKDASHLNTFFRVNDLEYPRPWRGENDVLEFRMGDLNGKEGEVKVTKVKNSIPLVETQGFVRLINDEIPLRIDDGNVKIEKWFVEDLPEKGSGSVPLTVLAGGNKRRYFQFDENQNLYATRKSTYQNQVQLRAEMLDDFNIGLGGYFTEAELKIFSDSFKKMENAYDIDFKKVKKDDKELIISEVDYRQGLFGLRKGGYNPETHEFYWSHKDRLIYPEKVVYGKVIDSQDTSEVYRTTVHETHHAFFNLDPEFEERTEQALKNIGFTTREEIKDNKRVVHLDEKHLTKELLEFLPDRLKRSDGTLIVTKIDEIQAYISEELFTDPNWLDDPKVSQGTRENRKKFREVYFQSMNKFKKSKNQ